MGEMNRVVGIIVRRDAIKEDENDGILEWKCWVLFPRVGHSKKYKIEVTISQGRTFAINHYYVNVGEVRSVKMTKTGIETQKEKIGEIGEPVSLPIKKPIQRNRFPPDRNFDVDQTDLDFDPELVVKELCFELSRLDEPNYSAPKRSNFLKYSRDYISQVLEEGISTSQEWSMKVSPIKIWYCLWGDDLGSPSMALSNFSRLDIHPIFWQDILRKASGIAFLTYRNKLIRNFSWKAVCGYLPKLIKEHPNNHIRDTAKELVLSQAKRNFVDGSTKEVLQAIDVLKCCFNLTKDSERLEESCIGILTYAQFHIAERVRTEAGRLLGHFPFLTQGAYGTLITKIENGLDLTEVSPQLITKLLKEHVKFPNDINSEDKFAIVQHRIIVLGELVQQGNSEKIIDALKDLGEIGDKDKYSQHHLVESLCKIEGKEAIKVLDKMVVNQDQEIVKKILYELAQLPSEKAVEILQERVFAVSQPDPNLVNAALSGWLSSINTDRSFNQKNMIKKIIRNGFRDGSIERAAQQTHNYYPLQVALRLLGKVGHKEDVNQIIKPYAKHNHKWVKFHAFCTMVELVDPDLVELIKMDEKTLAIPLNKDDKLRESFLGRFSTNKEDLEELLLDLAKQVLWNEAEKETLQIGILSFLGKHYFSDEDVQELIREVLISNLDDNIRILALKLLVQHEQMLGSGKLRATLDDETVQKLIRSECKRGSLSAMAFVASFVQNASTHKNKLERILKVLTWQLQRKVRNIDSKNKEDLEELLLDLAKQVLSDDFSNRLKALIIKRLEQCEQILSKEELMQIWDSAEGRGLPERVLKSLGKHYFSHEDVKELIWKKANELDLAAIATLIHNASTQEQRQYWDLLRAVSSLENRMDIKSQLDSCIKERKGTRCYLRIVKRVLAERKSNLKGRTWYTYANFFRALSMFIEVKYKKKDTFAFYKAAAELVARSKLPLDDKASFLADLIGIFDTVPYFKDVADKVSQLTSYKGREDLKDGIKEVQEEFGKRVGEIKVELREILLPEYTGLNALIEDLEKHTRIVFSSPSAKIEILETIKKLFQEEDIQDILINNLDSIASKYRRRWRLNQEKQIKSLLASILHSISHEIEEDTMAEVQAKLNKLNKDVRSIFSIYLREVTVADLQDFLKDQTEKLREKEHFQQIFNKNQALNSNELGFHGLSQAETEGIKIYANEDKWKMILENLVQNSLKAYQKAVEGAKEISESKSECRIAVRMQLIEENGQPKLKMVVEDNGRGFEDSSIAVLNKIVEQGRWEGLSSKAAGEKGHWGLSGCGYCVYSQGGSIYFKNKGDFRVNIFGGAAVSMNFPVEKVAIDEEA